MPDDPSIRSETLLVKGVPVAEIKRWWKKGYSYGWILRRYPSLTWADASEAIYSKGYALLQARLAEGKTLSEIARELNCSPSNVWVMKRRIKRNQLLRRDWGGLSPRAVTLVRKLGYKNFQELSENPPHEHKLRMTKGVGLYTFQEIQRSIVLKLGPQGLTRDLPSARISPPPRREGVKGEPPMYITKLHHFKEAISNPNAPKPAREMALFLNAVVKSAQALPLGEDEMLPSDVSCMAGPRPRRFCLGVVDVWRTDDPPTIHWECPVCKKAGVISGFEEIETGAHNA